jgi:hypothetical protein
MAAYTASVTGDWSDTATWGGSGPPGNGDSFEVKVPVIVDTNVEVGTSGATDTIDGVVDATAGNTGSLTVAAGVDFLINGGLQLKDSVLTMEAGSRYIFGNGGSAQKYPIFFGSTTGQTNSRILCNGTTGAHVSFLIEAGAGVGSIRRLTGAATEYGGFVGTFVDFSDIGDATIKCLDFRCNGTNQKFDLRGAAGDPCTFNRCGKINGENFPTNRDIYLEYITFSNPAIAANVGDSLTTSVSVPGSTAQRVWRHLSFKDAAITIPSQHANFVLQDVVCGKFSGSGQTGASISELIIVPRVHNAPPVVSAGGSETWSNIGVFYDVASAGYNEWMFSGGNGSSDGTLTMDGVVLQSTIASERADGISLGVSETNNTVEWYLKNWIVCLNSRMWPSCNIFSGHGTKKISIKAEHCTGGTFDNTLAGASNEYFLFNIGAEFPGFTGMVPTCRSNLAWAPVPLSQYGYILEYYGLADSGVNGTWGLDGTAKAGSTTTTLIRNETTAWNTGTEQGWTGAEIWITAKTGSGPEVGEHQTYASHTSNSVTVGTAFSATPDSGTTFRVVIPDVATPTGVDYNAGYNVRSGTIYDEGGQNPTSQYGIAGFCLSAAVGANDVDLGTGSDPTGAGPQFVDYTRGFHNWPNRYLGPEGILTTPADWATATGYVVGDRVKNNDAAWYNDEVLWYRCIADHTSGATTEPGVGASWGANWEFDFSAVMQDSCGFGATITDATYSLSSASYPLAVLTWIREGFRPQNEALRGAAHDSGDIGAVPMAAGGGPSIPAIANYYHSRRRANA